jgi:hypothetical protein
VWGLEIDIEAAKEDLRGLGKGDNGKEFDDFLDGMGLGGVTDQLKKLRLGEILDTPPPGIDEAAAIAKVVQLLKREEFIDFSRIVFDTVRSMLYVVCWVGTGGDCSLDRSITRSLDPLSTLARRPRDTPFGC